MKKIVSIIVSFIVLSMLAVMVFGIENNKNYENEFRGSLNDINKEQVNNYSEGESIEDILNNKDYFPENYIGLWSDEKKINHIVVYRVDQEGVMFHTGIFRTFGFHCLAIKDKDLFVFGDGISPIYWGPKGLHGSIMFTDNSVIVRYDSFGELGEIEKTWGNQFEFSVKESDSVEEYAIMFDDKK